MNVTQPKPASRIADYVERILVIDGASITTSFALPLFANGTPTLLFLSTKATLNNNTTNYLTLFGQTVFPTTLKIKDNFTLIAYFFKPYALLSLFGVAARELTDNPIDLNLLDHGHVNELKEKLLHAPSAEAMLLLLDDYIFSLITKVKTESQLIRYATAIIAHNPSKESLAAVQNELYVTERTFERIFHKDIGLSPNQYRRICQFNTAFQQLNNRRFLKLTDIALENGYADQSHFIRAFKEYTHITPKEYLKFGQPDSE